MSGTYEISLSSPKLGRTNSFRRKSSLVNKSDLREIVYEQEVLMRWVNHVLERSFDCPDTLDFSDGVCLIKLVDKLAHTNKTIQTHSSPILQFQKHHNYQSMLNFLLKEGVRLPSQINADGLLLSDAQMQYKFVWELIKHYRLKSSQKLLLEWVNKLVTVRKVRNFEGDWSDGVVLYTFVNTIVKGNNPDSCCPKNISPQNLISSALATANDILCIPPILIDLTPLNLHPSSKSLLTYLSCFIRPYYSNIKRWLHMILPGRKFVDFQSCWSNGHLLALLFEKVYPGICKDILKSYSHKSLSADTQRNNVRELLGRANKTMCINSQLDPDALVSRTAEPLSIAVYLDEVRLYSIVKRPIHQHLAFQTSDYETASLDSFSTNSVSRTFSEVSMTGSTGPVNNYRYRERRRCKSFESLNKFTESSGLGSITEPNTLSGSPLQQNGNSPFSRKDAERHSSGSLTGKRMRLDNDIPTHLTYSLDYFLDSEKSQCPQVEVGIREVSISVAMGSQVEQGIKVEGSDELKMVKKRRSNHCCIITSLIFFITLLLLLMALAGSAIIFCTIGHHCGRN